MENLDNVFKYGTSKEFDEASYDLVDEINKHIDNMLGQIDDLLDGICERY